MRNIFCRVGIILPIFFSWLQVAGFYEYGSASDTNRFVSLNLYHKPYFLNQGRATRVEANAAFFSRNYFSFGGLVNMEFSENQMLGVEKSDRFSIGPFLRATLKKKRFQVYGQTSIAFGLSSLRETNKYVLKRNIVEFGLILGVAVRLHRDWFLDFQYKFLRNMLKEPGLPKEWFVSYPLVGVLYKL